MIQRHVRRCTGTFTACTETGHEVTIQVFTTSATMLLSERWEEEVVVSVVLRTEDGRLVNRIKQGEYRLASTCETLRSTDPRAP